MFPTDFNVVQVVFKAASQYLAYIGTANLTTTNLTTTPNMKLLPNILKLVCVLFWFKILNLEIISCICFILSVAILIQKCCEYKMRGESTLQSEKS